MKNLATIIQKMWGKDRYATVADIRGVFGDYHNALRWLALFLIGDEQSADACIVDACTVAQSQAPTFHEWLIHWGALATLRCAFHRQGASIAELASQYEQREPVQKERPPLSAEHFRVLVEYSEDIYARLDVLCRFVLVMRGIAKDRSEEVAAKLRISSATVERAYLLAFDVLEEKLRKRSKIRRGEDMIRQREHPRW